MRRSTERFDLRLALQLQTEFLKKATTAARVVHNNADVVLVAALRSWLQLTGTSHFRLDRRSDCGRVASRIHSLIAILDIQIVNGSGCVRAYFFFTPNLNPWIVADFDLMLYTSFS